MDCVDPSCCNWDHSVNRRWALRTGQCSNLVVTYQLVQSEKIGSLFSMLGCQLRLSIKRMWQYIYTCKIFEWLEELNEQEVERRA